ncbi:hypothetical protein BH10CHL1_BH10CHL1_40290 [soil metagenome]
MGKMSVRGKREDKESQEKEILSITLVPCLRLSSAFTSCWLESAKNGILGHNSDYACLGYCHHL